MRLSFPDIRRLVCQPGLLLGFLTCSCAEHSKDVPLHSLVDGQWSTNCVARSDLFASYRIELSLIAASQATRTELYYADSQCTEAVAQLQYQGRYELMVTVRDFIYGMDLYFEDLALEALNDDGQKRLEQTGFCGRQRWPLTVAQNPVNFDPANCSAVGPTPLKNLNLVRIELGFSLSFGFDLANENDRPLEIAADDPVLMFYSQNSH